MLSKGVKYNEICADQKCSVGLSVYHYSSNKAVKLFNIISDEISFCKTNAYSIFKGQCYRLGCKYVLDNTGLFHPGLRIPSVEKDIIFSPDKANWQQLHCFAFL